MPRAAGPRWWRRAASTTTRPWGSSCRASTPSTTAATRWPSFGAPSKPADEPHRGVVRFDLTDATVFSVNGALRIAVVGTTERVTRLPDGTGGHQFGGEAVVLLWNGSTWAWQTPIRVARFNNNVTGGMSTVPFQTTSVTAVRTPTAVRVSIFGQDQSGGTVREIHSPDGVSWTVNNL